MGPIPPDKSWEEIDREAIALGKARRESGRPCYPAERVHQLILELEKRFNDAGWADPTIVNELMDQLRKEAGR